MDGPSHLTSQERNRRGGQVNDVRGWHGASLNRGAAGSPVNLFLTGFDDQIVDHAFTVGLVVNLQPYPVSESVRPPGGNPGRSARKLAAETPYRRGRQWGTSSIMTRRVTAALSCSVYFVLPCASTNFAADTAQVTVSFSPNGGCTDAVVRELSAAQKQVLVQAYAFTSAP